jgi:hypothetical protein
MLGCTRHTIKPFEPSRSLMQHPSNARPGMNITDYHAKYFAHELTKRCSSDSLEKLAQGGRREGEGEGVGPRIVTLRVHPRPFSSGIRTRHFRRLAPDADQRAIAFAEATRRMFIHLLPEAQHAQRS